VVYYFQVFWLTFCIYSHPFMRATLPFYFIPLQTYLISLLLLLSLDQILSPAACCQTPSNYVLTIEWDAKFHTYTKQRLKLSHSFLYLNPYGFRQETGRRMVVKLIVPVASTEVCNKMQKKANRFPVMATFFIKNVRVLHGFPYNL
jgi:hypothetical protein